MSIPITNPVVADLLKVTYRAYQNGQLGEVTCGYAVQSVGGGGLAVQQIADQLTTLSEAQWPAVLTPQAHTLGTQVEYIDHVTGVVLQSATGPDLATPGTVVSDSCPAAMGAIIKKNTGLAGRANRGRVFVPFVPDTFLTPNGELSLVAKAVYLTFGNALFSTQTLTVGAATTAIQPTIIHHYSIKHHTGLPVLDQVILSISVPGTLGSQRRRGDYGHRNADF